MNRCRVYSVQNIAINRIRIIFDSSNTLVYRLGPVMHSHRPSEFADLDKDPAKRSITK